VNGQSFFCNDQPHVENTMRRDLQAYTKILFP
jgi:hypothetical protein